MPNIKTFFRIRGGTSSSSRNPYIPYETEHDFERSKVRFHVDKKTDSEVVNHSIEDYTFTYDRIFDTNSTQEQVFEGVCRECCQNVLEGYNSTVFAYGQTGSGKTHSITGGTESRAQRGLIPRAISMIYEEISKRKEYQWQVGISYLQIYNDKGSDLLNRGEDANSVEDLPVVNVLETEDDVILKGLECHPSASVEEALNLLFLGDTNRLYCETPMNKTSSRSHCIFTVSLEARQHGSAMVRRSKLNLVDLAGSERVSKTGVSGTVLNEAKHINVSLHFLECVITALAEQARGRRDHVPYRNSMMTMVLRDSLGGNCKTTMLATAHPGMDQLLETMSTCRFAQRVASIKTEAWINEEQDPTLLVRQLKKEVASLKEQVAFLSGGKDSDPSRQLSMDEMDRCRELAQKFVDDPEENAELVGAGSDMARIHACFKILRDMAKKNPNSKKMIQQQVQQQTPQQQQQQQQKQVEAVAVVPTMSSEQEQLLREEVRRLRTSLQMKENEMTLLFDLLNRNSNNNNNNNSNIGGGNENINNNQQQVVAQQQQQQQQQISSASAAISNSVPQQQQQPQPLTPAQSESDYNLSALSDPELLKDRTTAFEAFRRSYRKQEHMKNCHGELEQRCGVAKGVAGEINGLIEQMKSSKSRIQQLRAERALQEDPEQVNPEEAGLLKQLHEQLRPLWTTKTEALKAEKEKIQHLQLIIKRSQEQLIKDFDAWFGARHNQVQKALNTSSSTAAANTSNINNISARSLNNNSNVNVSLFSNSSSSSSTPGKPTSTSTTTTNSIGSSSAFQQAAQQMNANSDFNNSARKQQQQQQNTNAATTTTTTTTAPKTGNPQVDAELQRMYAAREALRAKLATNVM